jgi:hypothetical protein
MNPILRNIIAVVVGVAVGMVVNMSLVNAGHSMYPVAGLDPNDMEAMKAIFPTLEAKYFIFPFLAHALGTLVGAFVVAFIAATHKMKFAISVGCFFLLGGIIMSFMIGGPMWFVAVDIIFAYIPMAWLGGKIAFKFSKEENNNDFSDEVVDQI